MAIDLSAGLEKAQPAGKDFQVHKDAPKPTRPGQRLKMNGKIVAESRDGKTWGVPAPAFIY
jgi:hypothetical protein